MKLADYINHLLGRLEGRDRLSAVAVGLVGTPVSVKSRSVLEVAGGGEWSRP